jgi:hypothetical protein
MRLLLTAAITSMAVPAIAADATISIDIPQLNVAEYHRPYVAFWLEGADGGKITNLAVWYATKLKDNEGTKWLKDMRQWWRRTGRELTLPADGLSSPTRAPGTHQLSFSGSNNAQASLAPGNYTLVVEAAREVGGRELLRVPFEWPPNKSQTFEAEGEAEIGAVTLKLTP